jgi:hypothetical protein
MTQKKLRLVRAGLFGKCSVRRGTLYLERECSAARSPRPDERAARGCGAGPSGAVSRTIDHARTVVR